MFMQKLAYNDTVSRMIDEISESGGGVKLSAEVVDNLEKILKEFSKTDKPEKFTRKLLFESYRGKKDRKPHRNPKTNDERSRGRFSHVFEEHEQNVRDGSNGIGFGFSKSSR